MRNCSVQFIGWCISALLVMEDAQAQCTYNVSTNIEDLNSVNVQFSVENLLIADLSAGQGICAVELRFRHSYVGDLTIDLISPAGQVVQLVGDVTDLINPTNLTTWDVRFLRCGFPAAPDAGFSAQWNNNQPWQVFTTYTGSYYPASGCLEDFNTGSANGIWQLVITDHDAFQTGVLLEITLIFCDNTGLICNVCSVDAGSFNQSMVSICEGTDIPIMPVFSDTTPDPDQFGYTMLLSTDQVNYSYIDEVQTSTFVPGTYTICGMSYSLSDSFALFMQLDTLTFSEVQAAFMTSGIEHCAELTETCITVVVHPEISTTFLDRQICAGECIDVGGQSFCAPGTHVVTIDVNGPCDSIVILELEVIEVEARVVQQDTISCEDGTTVLDGSGSIAGQGATFLWTTDNGTITSPPDQQFIMIDGSGSYSLQVTYQGCTDILVYDVIGDGSIPFLFVQGGTLDCNNPTFVFRPVAYPTNVEYSWTGPDGFSSQEQQPEISNPGIYMLLVTDPLGCSAATSVEVTIDTSLTAVVQHVLTECIYQRGTLRAQFGFPGFSFLWTFPDGSNATDQEIYATMTGQYCVEVTGQNGCSDVACIDYVADYTFPDITLMVSDDTLQCNTDVILTASSSVPGVIFNWMGPGGAFPAGATQSVNSPGQYIVIARAPNGCNSLDTTVLHAGNDLLEYAAFTGTLTCETDTVLIGVAILDPVVSYTWTGPGLVDTFFPFVEVTSPGTYEVEIVAQSGCVQHVSVSVAGDYSTVYYTVVTDTITCVEPIAELTFIAYDPYEEVDWLSPDGMHYNQDTLYTTEPGKYDLTLIGENGCPRTLVLHVIVDTAGPILFLDSGILGCNDSVHIETIKVDSIVSYQWSGPGGFTSVLPSPSISLVGTYTLRATGINGCTTELSESIVGNMNLPTVTLVGEELDCIDSMAMLTIMSPDSGVVYAWLFNNAEIASTAEVLIGDPGEYVAMVTGLNQCIVFDSIIVEAPVIPQVFSESDTVTCTTPAELIATSDLQGVDFNWTDSESMTGTGSQFSTWNPGPLLLTATASNGCSHDTTLIIEADTLAPIAVAVTQEFLRCALQTIYIDGSASIGTMLIYQWSSTNGTINSGANTATPQVIGEGDYVLSVTDLTNGCTDQDTLQLVEQESTLQTIFITAISECEGNGNASITIDSVAGASSGLSFLLDGVVGGPLFDHLSSGEYHLMVVDSFGCTLDSAVLLSNTSSTSTITLGEDKSIVVGDSVFLEVLVNIDTSLISEIHWGAGVTCDTTCYSNTVAPIQTTMYEVFLTDVYGCVASDNVIVFVEERPRYYIPNVFSPNGDNINDDLVILTHAGIEQILRFSIFDRWGNVVFHATDFLGGGAAWDGTFGGKKLDPGVFVYVLEVKLVTGRVVTNHGSISLVK